MRHIVYFSDTNAENSIVDIVATEYNEFMNELKELFPNKAISNTQKIEDESKLFKCKYCGSFEYPHWVEEANAPLIKNQWCFTCNYWFDLVKWAENGDKDPHGSQVIRANGYHQVAYIDTRIIIKGNGGRKFKFQLLNGEIIECNNVWDQGDIPDRFKHLLPDNAIKISPEPIVFSWIKGSVNV